jgi:amidase
VSLRAAGATVVDDARPVDLADGHDIAQRLIQGAISHAFPPEEYERLAARARASDASDNAPPLRWARNITQSARDFNMVLERRAQHAAAWASFFERHDVVLCPVTLAPAFSHTGGDPDERTILVDGTARSYGDQFAWLQATGVVHLPVTVAPVGRTAAGLPVGVQIVAPYLEDRTSIDVARGLATVVGGFVPPPGF